MATLGVNDLKQYSLPANWDTSELTKVRLQSGETYEQFISDVAAGLAALNAGLLSDPLVSGLISTTTDLALEYRSGVSNGFEEATEYGRPDAARATTTGHMLPLVEYDRGLGWTWMFLRKARRLQLDSDIASAMADIKNLWHQKVLRRLFKSTYDSVGSGKSVPICDGGTADSSYIPYPVPDRGGTFLYTHTHLLRMDGITQANLETAIAHLWEHGHDAPYDLLVSQTDIGDWTNTTNVTGYVPRPDPLLRYGVQTDLSAAGQDFIGAIETDYGACRIRATGRIPTKYWAVYKSLGAQDQRNVLRVRYNPRMGIGAVLLAGDHIREYPLENAILWSEFGVGVGEDRTAAAVVFNHNDNAYVDPTIS
jgi:hypothetical protein